jgi:hypothetical protein
VSQPLKKKNDMTTEIPYSAINASLKERIEFVTALDFWNQATINLNPKPKNGSNLQNLKKLLQMAPGSWQNLLVKLHAPAPNGSIM